MRISSLVPALLALAVLPAFGQTPCPTSPPLSVGISFQGSTSNCAPNGYGGCPANTEIVFSPSSTLGQSGDSTGFEPCDRFEWDFGDGTPTQTTQVALHGFSRSSRVTLT